MKQIKKEIIGIPSERIINRIFLIRGKKVMIDQDLAELYEVETKALNLAVKRNINRFPPDFMFQLSEKEFKNLRSQIETSSWGGRRYPPYAFTEQGVAMLSSPEVRISNDGVSLLDKSMRFVQQISGAVPQCPT